MCNRIYLFIFLLLDAKLLTEQPPQGGRREGVCGVSVRRERAKGQANAWSGLDPGVHMGCAYEAGGEGCS